MSQIAACLREPSHSKDVAKRLPAQYLREGHAGKVLEGHPRTSCKGVHDSDLTIMDGTDISKGHARHMEGL